MSPLARHEEGLIWIKSAAVDSSLTPHHANTIEQALRERRWPVARAFLLAFLTPGVDDVRVDAEWTRIWSDKKVYALDTDILRADLACALADYRVWEANMSLLDPELEPEGD